MVVLPRLMIKKGSLSHRDRQVRSRLVAAALRLPILKVALRQTCRLLRTAHQRPPVIRSNAVRLRDPGRTAGGYLSHPKNHISCRRCTLGARVMADELDQDVQALKNWLRGAWRFLASNPSLTPFERQELRNSMKQVESTLRAAVQQLAAKESARREALPLSSDRASLPDFRVLARPMGKDAQDVAA